MSIIDNQGRLFGRLNIVDAAVGVFVLALIPIAYGTSLLFRPARPRIDSVNRVDITNEERRVASGNLLTAKLKVKGSGLNPMLRATIDGNPALAFVFENPNSADVLVGPVAPGAHDLVLSDGVQEVARAKGAVVIDSLSSRTIRAEGWLTNMEPAMAAELKVGSSFPASGGHQVVAIGPPHPARSRIRMGDTGIDVPIAGRVERLAVLTLACDPQGADFRTGQEPCTVGGQQVVGGTPMTVALPGPITIGFSIEEIFPPEAPSRARLELTFDDGPEAKMIKTGDRDALLDERAALVSATHGRDVTIEAGIDGSREGWRYRGRPIKPGSDFVLATDRYEAKARVRSLTILAAPPTHTP